MFNKKRLNEIAKCPSVYDLASSYGRLHQGTIDIEIYQAGAMEVVKRIEDKLDFYFDRPNEFYGAIERMVGELKGEDMVEQAEGKYYVYGFWHIYPTNDIVTKGGVKEITEFGNIDDALAFIKKRSKENINITYCMCRDRCYVEKELKGE